MHELTNTLIQTITEIFKNSTQIQSTKDEHVLKSVGISINRGSTEPFNTTDRKLLMCIEKEVDKTQEKLFEKQEEIIVFECEIDDLKNLTPVQTPKYKESELIKKVKTS